MTISPSQITEATPLQELIFSDARGGRKPSVPLRVDIVRALVPGDIAALSGAVAAPAQRLLQIRHAHHNLAQLIAKGLAGGEIALVTGYSPAYISSIQNDPAMAELIQYYAIQREQVFVDVLERLKALGLNSVDEIQQRLEAEPEKWSRRELMELAELALIKPQVASARGGAVSAAGPGVSIEVKFVGAGQAASAAPIDITPGKGGHQ